LFLNFKSHEHFNPTQLDPQSIPTTYMFLFTNTISLNAHTYIDIVGYSTQATQLFHSPFNQ